MNTPSLANSLEQAKAYLLEDKEVERGGLITADGRFIPFRNQAKHPRGLIEMGPEDVKIMTRLLREDNLFGWIHSHPHCEAWPSVTDVTMHQAPISMIIYSIRDDDLNVFDNSFILRLRAGMNDGSEWLDKE